MGETHKERYVRKGSEHPCPPQVLHSPLHLHVVTNADALWTLSFWVFMEASLQRHG